MRDLAQQLKDAIDRKLPEGFEQSFRRMKQVLLMQHVLHPVMRLMQLRKQFLHSLEEVLTLQAPTKRQSKEQAISFQPIIPVAIFGSVYVNSQWELR